LIQAKARGYQVVFTSGRGSPAIKVFLDQIGLGDSYFIALNGALIKQGNNELRFNHLNAGLAKDLKELADEFKSDFHFHYYNKDHVFINHESVADPFFIDYLKTTNTPFSEECYTQSPMDLVTKWMFVGDKSAMNKALVPAVSELFKGRANFCYSSKAFFEVFPKEADKGTAARHIMGLLGVSPEDCFAFGDQANDISLLGVVGHSFVMQNASEELYEQLDTTSSQITKWSNAEDGVARTLLELVV